MPAYWIAHVTVHDSEAYKMYMALAKPAFEKYGAKFLLRSETYHNLEGESFARHVIIEFTDMQTALACYHSPEYVQAREARAACATAMITLAESLV